MIRLYSWNVNGYRAAVKKGFREWLTESEGDIVCLQETKALAEQLEDQDREPEGYHSSFHSAERKGYSGVATFSRFKPKSVELKIGKKEFDTEGRVIRSDFSNFILFNVYFPNGQKDEVRLDYKMRFYEHFLKYINKLRDEGKKIVVCGDYNTAHKEIDLARPKANQKTSGFLPVEREWMDKLTEAGYLDTFRLFNEEGDRYSWWSMRSGARARNVGWRIDYFFVSENLRSKVAGAEIHPDVMGSDHCPVSLDLDYKKA